jgi:hypothetical protein
MPYFFNQNKLPDEQHSYSLIYSQSVKTTDHGEARGIDGGEKLKDVNVKL